MVTEKKKTENHPTDLLLADYLDKRLSPSQRKEIEAHVIACDECLNKMVCAYETVKSQRKEKSMGKVSLYLIFAAISFLLSFIVPRFFLQFLVATLLLGAKWVADSKSTKMLIMIHEAWKNEGEHGASEVIRRFDSSMKKRV
jgi:hypothetical protein